MSWDQKFEDPVTLPSGEKLVTLRNAAEYITKLPKDVADQPAWQTAVTVLLQAAEMRGPVMHASIGMMQALYPKPINARIGR